MGAAIGRVSVAEVVSAGSGTMIDGNTMYYGGRDKEMDGKFFFFFCNWICTVYNYYSCAGYHTS